MFFNTGSDHYANVIKILFNDTDSQLLTDCFALMRECSPTEQQEFKDRFWSKYGSIVETKRTRSILQSQQRNTVTERIIERTHTQQVSVPQVVPMIIPIFW